MVGKFVPFDDGTIKSELRSLPSDDRAALTEAMMHFQKDHGIGYTVKSYAGGIQMITGSGKDQGRGLFFMSEIVANADGSTTELLVLLLAYKKETMKVPASILATARRRREAYLSE